MKQFDKDYSELIQSLKILKEHGQHPYSTSSLFVLSKNINVSQLKVIEEATLKKQPVTVITSMDMRARVKNDLLQLLTEYEDNTFNPNFWLYRLVRIIGYVIIVLGLFAVGLYGFFSITKNPIIKDQSILALFVPLLVAYLGFQLVDFIDRQLLKRFKLRPNLELIILKNKNFKTSESIMVLNDEIGYFESKKILKEFEMDQETIDRLANLIVFARNMDKRDRLVSEKNAIWLLED